MMLGIYLNVSWALMMCRTILLVSSAPVDNDWLNSEQVTRCHGIPCQEWDEIQEQLAELKEQAKKARPGEIEPGVLSVLQDDGDTIDGDIWPTLSHINSLKKNFQTRFKRKLATFGPNNTRWDDMPIEYYLDKKFNSSQVDAIQGATRHWEAQTCVTFREITYTEAVNRIDFSKPFLYFVKHHRCGTFVGKIPAASGQQIFLSDKCIQQWGAIVHEIGHILGFWHEHQRSDRDKFVTIFPDRMVAFADKSQYEVGNTRNNVRYDYGSVMHYWAWTNSASLDSITIEPHDMRYLYTIGQKIELSFLDAKLANIEYCSDRCSNAIACHNQGYQDPNNCHKCKCPDGFSGDQCDEVAPSENAVCGGNIDLTDEAGRRSTYITSPGYSEGKTYKDHTSCTWHIMAPKGYNVNLVFMNKSSDHFGMYCKYPVCFHWAEVKTTSSDMSITGPRFCCEYINRKSVLPGILTSDGRLMVLMMKSNFTTPDNDAVLREGFRAFVHISKDTNTATDKDDGATKKLTQQTPQTAPAPSPTGRKSKLDVVFVMDSSGSVGRENWSKIKTFTKDVISNLLDGLHDYKFAFVTFGSSAYINIHLDQYSSYRQFSDVISSLSWEQGSSNIADGLRKARQELLVTRPNIPNLVVLVTDGPATAEQSNTESEAQMLRQMENTHLLAIGLTTNVNTNVANQLQRMASSPTDKFVKIFDNYDGLNDVAMVVANVAEELGKPTDTETTTTTRPTTTPTRKTTTTPKPTTTPQPTTTTPQPTTTTTPKPTTTTPKPTTTTPKPTTTPKETTTPKPTTTKQTTTPITITKQTTTQPTTIKQTVSTTVTTEKGTTANSFSWRCDFEEAGVPFCGMAQEDGGDQFDWTRNRGPTLSSHTGPDSAASNKYYIYIEASRPRKLDDTACVYTPEVPHDGEYCLHFQYHMYGYHVKELRVQEVSHDGDVTGLDLIGHGKSVKGHRNRAPVSWTERKQGVEGNTKWQTESLDIYLAGKSKIAFTGVRGPEYSGDIALDDISLHSGACTS